MAIGTAVFILFSFSITSCKKGSKKLPAQKLSVGRDVRLNDVHFSNVNTGYACGGIKNEVGYVYKTLDAGNTWTEYTLEHDFGMHCLFFLNDSTAWVGGDYLHYYKTTNAGLTWEFQWLENQVPFNEEDRPVIREMQFLDVDNGYFVGGEYYNSGVIYHTTDGGDNWDWDFYENDMRGMHVLDCDQAYFCGHGLLIENDNCENAPTDLGFYNTFYVAVHQFDETNSVIVGNEGGIFRSSDGGSTWDEILSPNSMLSKRKNLNAMHFDGQIGFVVGNDGLVFYSNDSGMSWDEYEIDGKPILTAVYSLGNRAWITSTDGSVYQIDI